MSPVPRPTWADRERAYRETCEPLEALGLCFTPLRGKAAYLPGWQNTPLSLTDALAHAKHVDGNIGIVLGERWSAIDVDEAKHPGALRRATAWAEAHDLDLGAAIVVRSGGGPDNRHYYFRVPQGARIRREKELAGAGVEFMTGGRQLVAPASIHPTTGRLYQLDDDSVALLLTGEPAVLIPAAVAVIRESTHP